MPHGEKFTSMTYCVYDCKSKNISKSQIISDIFKPVIDRERQRETERDRERQRETEGDRERQRETE